MVIVLFLVLGLIELRLEFGMVFLLEFTDNFLLL